MGIRNLNKLLEYYGNAKNLYFSGREELCKACFVTGINDINIIDEIDMIDNILVIFLSCLQSFFNMIKDKKNIN